MLLYSCLLLGEFIGIGTLGWLSLWPDGETHNYRASRCISFDHACLLQTRALSQSLRYCNRSGPGLQPSLPQHSKSPHTFVLLMTRQWRLCPFSKMLFHFMSCDEFSWRGPFEPPEETEKKITMGRIPTWYNVLLWHFPWG